MRLPIAAALPCFVMEHFGRQAALPADKVRVQGGEKLLIARPPVRDQFWVVGDPRVLGLTEAPLFVVLPKHTVSAFLDTLQN